MRKSVYIFSLILLAAEGYSQGGYFQNSKQRGEKYFVALGYGFGTAHWNSVFKSTEFYDKDGSVINTGDLHFSANSPSKNLDVNVMAPIGHVRLGLGINFEFHYLSQLKIYTKYGDDYLLFDEGLRFDKIYLEAEVPFKFSTDKKYSFSWNSKVGWFGYTNVKRFNFLGEKPFPISVLGSTGVMIDHELYPQVYVFVLPNVEYKFYDNSGLETPVEIRHNVVSVSALCGIRVDMGKLRH